MSLTVMLLQKLIYQILRAKFHLFILLLPLSICFANDEKLQIKSSNLAIDRVKNSAVFSGEVVVLFDDIVLKTEEMIICYKKQDDTNKIDKIIINKPLSALKEDGKETIIAGSGVYYADKGILELKDNVKILRDGHILKTNTLVYHTSLKNFTQKK